MTQRFRSKSIASLTGSLVLLTALGACASYDAAKQTISDNDASTQALLSTHKNLQANYGPANIRFRDNIWLGSYGMRSENGQPLPNKFENESGITIISGDPMSLIEIAGKITSLTGIPVTGAESAREGKDSGNSQSVAAPASGPDALLGIGSSPYNTRGERVIDINWSGPLSGLLKTVAAHFEITWEYRHETIRFFNYESRTFTLIAPPSTSEVKSQIDSSIKGIKSDNEEDSSNIQGVSNSVKLDYWAKVKDTITALVPEGTKFSVSPEAGTVTVTASPSVLERVRDYIKSENARLSRQVAISLKVYSLSLEDSDSYGFDLNAVFQNNNFGVNFTGLSGVPSGIGEMAVGILSPSGSDMGKWNGSNTLVKALSKRGNMSLVTSAAVTTLNNQPVPVQVSKQTAYLARMDKTKDDSGDVSYAVEPGVVTTGFSANLLPRILTDGKIALQYNLALSDLTDMQTVGPSDAEIQVPEIDARGFMQNVMMRSGSTLVMAGYEQTYNTASNQGIGSPTNWLFGGGASGMNHRQIMIITLTPVIIEDPDQLSAPR